MESVMELSPNTTNKIRLTLLNGTGYVFNADDYALLRNKYRIIGGLFGASTQSNTQNGCTLPVQLTPYETQLLVEQGIAELVSKKEHLLRVPTAAEQEELKRSAQARIEKQAELFKIEKLKHTELVLNDTKVKSRKRKRKQLIVEDILENIQKELAFNSECALVEIPYEHKVPHVAKLVKSSIQNTFKYRVFRDLWLRGKYVTCGTVYGADFLAYNGDPMQFHASQMIFLLPTGKIKPYEMILRTRMAVCVGKICVLAYLLKKKDSEETEVKYNTVSWIQGINEYNNESDEDE